MRSSPPPSRLNYFAESYNPDMKTIIRVATTERTLYKRVPTSDGRGTTSVPDGREELHYEATVDLGALNDMARKAAGSKAGRSTDGPLTVRIVNRKRPGS